MFEWHYQTILAWVLAGIAVYFLWQSRFQVLQPGLDQRMREFASQAVLLAKSEHQLDLDYSLDSIAMIDTILDVFHRRHQTTPIPERELSRIVLIWGGYLGTVLKNRYGGTWQSDSEKAGKNTYPLRWKDHEAVPVMWCLQRIRRAANASLQSKVDEVVRRLERDSKPE